MTEKGDKILIACFDSRIRELESMKYQKGVDIGKIESEISAVKSLKDLKENGLMDFK